MADARAARIEALLPRLADDPSVFLHSLDLARDRGLVLEVDRAFYREATFLDERVLTPDRVGAWVPLERIWPVLDAAPPTAPLGFIFHLGRAGSTLLSRLLDQVPGVLGLREPLALRPLALAADRPAQARTLARLHALLARRFAGDRAVVVKATSICNVLASSLLAQHPGDRAIALTVGLRAHLANALDKPASDDLLGFAAHRQAVLRTAVPGFAATLAGQPQARLAALSWLAEMVALAPLRGSPQVRFVDFDALLAARESELAAVLAHLGLPVEAAGALASSAVFDDYSKQPGFAYDPAARRLVLERSTARNRAAIEDAEAFIAALCAQQPQLAAALAAPARP